MASSSLSGRTAPSAPGARRIPRPRQTLAARDRALQRAGHRVGRALPGELLETHGAPRSPTTPAPVTATPGEFAARPGAGGPPSQPPGAYPEGFITAARCEVARFEGRLNEARPRAAAHDRGVRDDRQSCRGARVGSPGGLSDALSAPEDVITHPVGQCVRARLALVEGHRDEAERWADSAVRHASMTDLPEAQDRAKADTRAGAIGTRVWR